MRKTVNFKGNPLTLVGRVIRVGDIGSNFRVVNQELEEVRLSNFKGKIKIITSFPSLDTPVCDLQVKEFNKRAAGFSSETVIIGISKDLPFAQKRFCQSNDIKNAILLSDYKFFSFGINYGLLIKELNLLARAVVILDKNDTVRYLEIVSELTTPPNYEDVLKNLKEVIRNPKFSEKEVFPSQCKPCEGGIPPLSKETINKLLAQYHNWQLVEDKKLVKEFVFKDFVEAKYFLDLVSIIAEDEGHHPTLTLIYNKLRITLTTHSAGGLTENDFIMAGIIDGIN